MGKKIPPLVPIAILTARFPGPGFTDDPASKHENPAAPEPKKVKGPGRGPFICQSCRRAGKKSTLAFF
jgi:hypothetical protein